MMRMFAASLLLVIFLSCINSSVAQVTFQINGEDRDFTAPRTVIGTIDSQVLSDTTITFSDTSLLDVMPFDDSQGQLESVLIDFSGNLQFAPTFSVTTAPGQSRSDVDFGLSTNVNLTGPLGLSSSNATLNLAGGRPLETAVSESFTVGSGTFGGRLVLSGDALDSFLGAEDAQLPLTLDFDLTASTSNGQLILNPESLAESGPRLTASTFNVSFVTSAVPEPSGLAILGGLGAIGLISRRRLGV
jgi:hypothetical protein